MDEEEFERRFQLYLEVFPFIAVDFRLKDDCHAIHRSATLDSFGHKIKSTTEMEPSYQGKAEAYRKTLEEIRENMDTTEFEIDPSGI
jgi:hypothetical protein